MNLSMLSPLAFVAVAALSAACTQPEAPAPAPESALGPRITNVEATAKPAAVGRAAKLVLVDKEQACDCTQAKVDAAWAAIRATWGSDRPAPQRIHADTQAAALEPLRRKRPMVTVPAVYVLDDSGGVLALLQGDVTEAALRAAVQ